MGAGIVATSSYSGLRTTSATATKLHVERQNLTIWTNSVVTRLHFDGKAACTVELANGKMKKGDRFLFSFENNALGTDPDCYQSLLPKK